MDASFTIFSGGGVAPCESLLPPWEAAMRSTFMKENGSDVRYAIALALALMTVLSMVAITSASPSDADDSAMSGDCGEDLTWELIPNGSDGTYTLQITGTGEMNDYNHNELPGPDGEKIEPNYPPWYSYSSKITEIILPDGLIRIGNDTFYGTAITSITIPDTVNSIGANAFWMCRSLESIILPSTIDSIGSGAFTACTKLSDVNFEDLTSLTSIGRGAFQSSAISSADLTKTQLTTISDGAFSYNDNLTSVSIPITVEEIKPNAFNLNKGLKTFTIPEDSALTTIGEKAFSGSGLTSVDLSNATELESIGKDAFGNCSSLTTVTLPDSVSFSEDAFPGSTIQFSLDIEYDNMTFYLSNDSGTVTIIPKGTMGVDVTLTVENTEIATAAGNTLTINATGTTKVTATATYEDKTYTDSFFLTVVQSPNVEGLTFLPMTDSMETAINQVEVPNVPMTDFVESTLVNIEPDGETGVGAIPYDVLGWSIDSSNFDDFVYYAVHYTGTGVYTPEVVSVTATSQGLEVDFKGFSPYVFGYTIKAVEPEPTPQPGYDDDEDLPPFIPAQPKDSGDDVTIVACAAAAVVAALMAVFLIVSYKKD